MHVFVYFLLCSVPCQAQVLYLFILSFGVRLPYVHFTYQEQESYRIFLKSVLNSDSFTGQCSECHCECFTLPILSSTYACKRGSTCVINHKSQIRNTMSTYLHLYMCIHIFSCIQIQSTGKLCHLSAHTLGKNCPLPKYKLKEPF